MTTTAATPATTIKRHPIRGFFYGIFFGLGLALIVAGQKWAALGTWPPFLVFFAGIVIGTLWATFGPAKKPKGAPPAAPVQAEPTPIAADPARGVGEPSAAGDETIEEHSDATVEEE